jgi:hypothetical protein
LAVISSTLLTIWFIFPYNAELASGITDPERLKTVFGKWATLNRIRVSHWVVELAAMMCWYFALAAKARADR